MIDLAQRIREMVPAREAAEHYGFYPNRSGYICCPFHKEKTASLKLFPDGGWKCFGCGAHGSAIDFVMQLFDINFRQAILRIDMDFGLGLTGINPTPGQRSEILSRRRKEAEKLNRYRLEYDNRCILFRAFYHILQSEKPKCWDDMSALYILALREYSALEYWFETHSYK